MVATAPHAAPAPLPHSTGNGAAPPSAQVEVVGGVTVDATTGEIVLDHLVPQGVPVELGPELDGIVHDARGSLSLEAVNKDFNPWKEEPKTPSGKPAIGHFADPTSIFFGKAFVPIRDVVTGGIKQGQGDQVAASLKPLLDALAPYGILDMPVQQYPLPGVYGNRVVFYGGARKHGDIDKLVQHLGARHLRVLKMMCHFNEPAKAGEGCQGGSIEEIVKEGVGGSTHCGGFSSGFANGAPATVKSDWPSDYGRLDDSHVTYNAHLLVVDYAQGTHDPIPERDLAAYKRNADMWDCCAGMLVPFAGNVAGDPYSNYKYNPLEVHNQATIVEVATAMAKLDQKSFLNQCGSFYCAEGQYSVANLGPQEATLLKQGRWGGSAFGQIIASFAQAPGYRGTTAEQRRQKPEIGWKHLIDTRKISQEHYDHLVKTDRTAIALEFISEDVKGWQAYRPKNAQGLVARPMSVATLAWGLLRRYMPRDAIAKLIVTDINRACATGGPAVQKLAAALTGGADPATPAGQKALAALAGRMATGLIVGVLSADETRKVLLQKAGYEEMSADDRKKVDEEYAGFMKLLGSAADSGSNDRLNAALAEADRRLAKLEVGRKTKNFDGQEVVKKELMLYAAPHCFGMWAQSPLLAETGCLRYVATAMHVDQMVEALRPRGQQPAAQPGASV